MCVGRGNAAWDKQTGVGVERERLLARTRDAVTKGLAAGNMWHAASNAEHARPMLQARTCTRTHSSLRAAPACPLAGQWAGLQDVFSHRLH